MNGSSYEKNRLVSAAIMTATVLCLSLGLSPHKLTTSVKAETASSDTSKIVAKFDKIEDGDTATLTYNGLSKPVQYLLIDTPETSKDQPYADKAKKRSEALLKSAQKIEIAYDKGDHQDKNNHELLYVWVDDQLLQETLVKEGLARVTTSNKTNTTQLDTLKKAEKNAKKQKLGIWRVEGYATKTGFKTKKYTSDKQVKSLTKKAKKALKLAEKTPTKENYDLAVSAINAIDGGDVALSKRLNAVNETITLAEQQKANAEKERQATEQAAQAEQQRIAAEQAAQAAQAEQQRVAAEQAAQAEAAAQQPAEQQYVDANGNGTIKGSSSRIYHVPGSTYYDRTTNPVAMFKTISEAEAAGYRPPKR